MNSLTRSFSRRMAAGLAAAVVGALIGAVSPAAVAQPANKPLHIKDTFGATHTLESPEGWIGYTGAVSFRVRSPDGAVLAWVALCESPGVVASHDRASGLRGEWFRIASTTVLWRFAERACGQS